MLIPFLHDLGCENTPQSRSYLWFTVMVFMQREIYVKLVPLWTLKIEFRKNEKFSNSIRDHIYARIILRFFLYIGDHYLFNLKCIKIRGVLYVLLTIVAKINQLDLFDRCLTAVGLSCPLWTPQLTPSTDPRGWRSPLTAMWL